MKDRSLIVMLIIVLSALSITLLIHQLSSPKIVVVHSHQPDTLPAQLTPDEPIDTVIPYVGEGF